MRWLPVWLLVYFYIRKSTEQIQMKFYTNMVYTVYIIPLINRYILVLTILQVLPQRQKLKLAEILHKHG